jgi:radical SAM protein with 4Fe4S-binding SPASM domain
MRVCVRMCVRLCRGWQVMPFRLLAPSPDELGLKPGTYKYDGTGDLAHHRFHIRVDGARKGVLVVDASKLIFLNGTALDYVRSILEGKDADLTYAYMKRRYKGLRRAGAREDYASIRERLVRFVEGEESVMDVLGSTALSMGADDMPAPYRMDLALTYRCENDCGHCYNATKEKKELTVVEWTAIIDRLWDVGIPHIVFTGGEPTLYDGLGELIARSEHHGQITGLVSNGRGLGRPGYLRSLVAKGLDHVQITVLSHEPETHDRLAGAKGAWQETVLGLKAALAEDVYVSTNTTIMRSNYHHIKETMRFLVGIGVRNIAFNGIIRSGKGVQAEGITYQELATLLDELSGMASETGTNLIWYSPTPYCELSPVNMGLGIKQCTACSLNMAVEPDGTVLPCQSYYEPLGNILTDDWPDIWGHTLCERIRKREYVDERCVKCEMLQLCGGGCPLSAAHGEYVCLDRHSSM